MARERGVHPYIWAFVTRPNLGGVRMAGRLLHLWLKPKEVEAIFLLINAYDHIEATMHHSKTKTGSGFGMWENKK